MIFETVIRKFDIFSGLRPEILSEIVQTSKLNFYKKGTIIYDALARGKPYFYSVINGWIKLFTISENGTEIIRDILSETHCFNENLLTDSPVNPLTAQAISDIQVVLTPIYVLKKWLAVDTSFASNFLKMLLQKQTELSDRIEHLSIQTMTQRIGCFLLKLHVEGTSSDSPVHLPYDKSLIATQLGMCPETFSRALLKLSKECELKVVGEKVTLMDPDAMKQLVCSECSCQCPCHAVI